MHDLQPAADSDISTSIKSSTFSFDGDAAAAHAAAAGAGVISPKVAEKVVGCDDCEQGDAFVGFDQSHLIVIFVII
jgi:hypothetical protein